LPVNLKKCKKTGKKYCNSFLVVYNRFRSADINTSLKEIVMEYKTTYPALEALAAKRAADPEWAAAEDARKAAIIAENRRIAYEAEYKVDMDEYWKLFNADKERFIAEGYSEKLAHSLACSNAQYREDSARGWSTD
jgi:hypothetical protein